MRKRNKGILLLLSLLICLFGQDSLFGQGEEVILPPLKTYEAVVDRLFPKFVDELDWQTHVFFIDVKEIPSFSPPSQISIIKFVDGTYSVRRYFLSNQKETITDQWAPIGESVTTMSVDDLITSLNVRSSHVRPSRSTSSLIEQFFTTPIRFRANTSITLDGVRYEVRYKDLSQFLEIKLVGSERSVRGEPQILTWARNLVRIAR